MNTGWERELRTHFDDIVEKYDKTRPEYPIELYADIFAYANKGRKISKICEEAAKSALEIGAGTGKATYPFIEAGYNVTAVEIGANMTAFLNKKFAAVPGFSVITAPFEDAGLAGCSYNLIYAATAYHWVDTEIGTPKALKLLKNGGTIALFRYNVMPADGNEVYEAMQAVYTKYGPKPYKRPIKRTKQQFSQPEGIYHGFRCRPLDDYGFGDLSMTFYDTTRALTTSEYMAMLDTNSDHRHLPEKERKALYSGIEDVIDAYGGSYTVDYIFQLYMGRKQEAGEC